MAITKECRDAFLHGVEFALEQLDITEKEYYVQKGDRLQQKLAKEIAVIALRKYRAVLVAAVEANKQEEADVPAVEPVKKKAKKTKE